MANRPGTKISNTILDTIGNTPLVRINRITRGVTDATVLAKIETLNPGNSIKDRMAVRMIEDAERSGKHALSIDPADVIGMRALLLAISNGSGDIKKAQGVLATFPSANDLISSSASGIVASVTGDRASG